MKKYVAGRALALVIVASTLVGCNDGIAPTEAARSASPRAEGDSIPRDVPRGYSEHRLKLAQRIAGYGGHTFTDAGVLIVHLTDLGRSAEARAALAQELELYRNQRGRAVAKIEFRQAKYEFTQLIRWRGRDVPRAVGSIPGVRMVRTNNEQNRVEVGVTSDEAAARVREALGRAGVPLDAVLVTPMEAPRYFAADDSLTSFARTVEGGRLIYSLGTNDGSPGACTAGLVGRGKAGTVFAGKFWMLTASHCTSTTRAMDDTYFEQPRSEVFGEGGLAREAFDGREWNIGETNSWWTCNYQDGCRHSDAVLLELFPTAERTLAVGRIARPTAKDGSLVVNKSNPFYVTDVNATYSLAPVHKVGITTGWTSGTIYDGDADADISYEDGTGGLTWYINVGLIKSMGADHGDSGAPIFEYSGSGNQVKFRGTLVGSTTMGFTRYIVYSPLASFNADINHTYGHLPTAQIEWRYGY